MYVDDPLALIYAHLCRANAAAIFGDSAALAEHSAAAMELLGAVHGFYAVAQIRLLRGLALAEEARATDADARDDLLAELDELTRWLAGWAPGAPDNFLHLLRLVEAERAWAAGAQPPRSTRSTGPTRPCDGPPTRPRRVAPPSAMFLPTDARPSRPGRSTSSGFWPRRRRLVRRRASNGSMRAWPRCSAR
jgi:hypothetical protein